MRWRSRFNGRAVTAGQYDAHISLLLMEVATLNLADVDDLDPDALDEIMAAYEAQSNHREAEQKQASRRR